MGGNADTPKAPEVSSQSTVAPDLPAYRVVEDDSKPPLSDLFMGDGFEAAPEAVLLRLPPTPIVIENTPTSS